jgi:coenzyme F420-0:L-glutamate ligase/coenzyme F420-1:gamma-L-glutamate ligase
LSANRTEFPALVPVYISERPASRAPDNNVHGQRVFSNFIIKIYRWSIDCDENFKKIVLKSVYIYVPDSQRNTFIRYISEYHDAMDHITVIGIHGLPLIQKGDNIASLICKNQIFQNGDILCIASTIYSKSKGYTKSLKSISPSDRAERLARLNGEDPRFVQVILDASADIIMEHPFILSELQFGHIGVRAGVDQSNIEDGMVIFLPPDPMKAADGLRSEIKKISGKNVGVIITDTCGRSFRRGQTGNAIGWSGMKAIRDFRGDVDLFGHVLKITEEAVVDEIAGFANFVMGESNNGVPAAIFRNCPVWTGHDNLYFTKDEDITRKLLKKELDHECA